MHWYRTLSNPAESKCYLYLCIHISVALYILPYSTLYNKSKDLEKKMACLLQHHQSQESLKTRATARTKAGSGILTVKPLLCSVNTSLSQHASPAIPPSALTSLKAHLLLRPVSTQSCGFTTVQEIHLDWHRNMSVKGEWTFLVYLFRLSAQTDSMCKCKIL